MSRVLDLLLPGARLLATLPVRGALTLAVWVALWTLAITRLDRVLDTLRGGAIDEWVALASLTGALLLVARAGRRSATGDPADDDAPGQWAMAWRVFRRHRTAMLGLALVGALALTALLTPYLAPFDPAEQGADIVATRFQSPSLQHPMGTDRFGRDVFSRVLYGGRVSLGIGGMAILIAITIGSLVGALAGYLRGWVDAASMRTVDLLLSFPRLVLLITIVALVEPSVLVITLVLGLTGWMGTSRLVRGEVLSLREREFVLAARALGFGTPRILLRHVLPNVATSIIVAATLGIGNTILVEASLSFLGLGVPPPAPSWGLMVAAGKDVMLDAPWIALFPGLAIVLTVVSFNLVGDGLRDALDPRTDRGVGVP
ncbi:MAG: ABC transporter permease [Gemmatimonadota bacterium]|nr:ABC transporter permease [Gemmatimonadota bacterium]